jgi:hypothetical protein
MSQAGATAEGATRAEPSARVPSDGAEPLDDAAPRGGDVRDDDAIASAPRSAAVGASARDDASARRAARIALERTSLRDRSERSEGALSGVTTSSYHSSDYSTSYSSGSVVSDGPPSEPGPGAPFPETFEEREARLLKTLNASMETNVKYWDRELERGVEAAPVPDVAAIRGEDVELVHFWSRRGRRRLASERSARLSARTSTLPEFILVADFEPTASAAGAATASECEASERLLVKYALEEGLVSEGEDASSAASAAAAAARAAAAADGGDWGGETYEPGAALSDGGPSARYLKFAKRLRRAPEQCVRYAFGGGAACWPEERERAAASRGGGGKNKKSSDASGSESRGGDASHPAAPACASCGAPRWLELQLTPPLLLFVAEAREWEGEPRWRSWSASGARGVVAMGVLPGLRIRLPPPPRRRSSSWMRWRF